ncbi:hypothetical protein AGR1C_Cc40266 [Agrobacterium fabacearum TT111]|nr:hypothetical protein AGR1C_Cc40266 [Agrobacterium fabacearum TT111]
MPRGCAASSPEASPSSPPPASPSPSAKAARLNLLILTQVVLSLQLSFAVFPLVMFTADRAKMGELSAPRWLSAFAWLIAVVIAALNVKLLFDFVG